MALPLTKQVVSKTNETRELQQELQAIVDEKLLPAAGRMEAALEKLEHGDYDELWRTKKLEDHSQWLPKVHWDLASDLKGLDKDGRAMNDEAFRRLEEHCASPLLQSTTSACGSRRIAQLIEMWLLSRSPAFATIEST
ncbi:hypothetical protein AK812_SmicGene16160 [Symbiodinium microadriaticum]|uniref:Uncharacterized protein n=1 Tax=Symbiodinium microadriaticum TaxID=2951 RepID=A0A1Q9E154_SYMMI|nr:hypothetical protein AK812_SmicGene16160 [Symbiodinium microadriaticum]